MRKKLLSVALCVAMATTVFVGCGSDKKDDKETTAAPAAEDTTAAGEEGGEDTTAAPEGGDSADITGSVYFLNFKPEIADS